MHPIQKRPVAQLQYETYRFKLKLHIIKLKDR